MDSQIDYANNLTHKLIGNGSKPNEIVVFNPEAEQDPRLTLVCYLPEHLLVKINDLQNKLKEVDPIQYYYSPESIHFTLVGGFTNFNKTDDLINLAKDYIRDKNNQLKLNIKGVGMNNYSITVMGFNDELKLSEFREQTRNLMGEKGDMYTTPNSIWSNIVRYYSSPNSKFKAIIEDNIYQDWGEIVPDKIYVLKSTSKLLLKDKTEIIEIIDL